MTEKAKHLYQAAEEKFNWINNELRRLNKDIIPPEDDEDYGDFFVDEELREETLYNFECLVDSFDDEYLEMFDISFDAEIKQNEDGEWECFDPVIILTSKIIPCLDIWTVCAGYYISGGDGESCDPTENCHPAAEALVVKYKKQYEEAIRVCKYKST